MSEGIQSRRIVDDATTLKALADPLRMTVLELMMVRPEQMWTAKELAARVGIPATKLYYHLNLLERHQLAVVRETRIVNGIIEKHYGAGQRRITFQRGTGDDSADGVREGIVGLIDKVRDDVDTGLRDGTLEPVRTPTGMVVSHALAALPPDRIAEFRTALLALVERFRGLDNAGGTPYQLLVAFHPQGPQQND
ncbi:MAG: ArsR/SmtB family transcription factor [Micromonosporaceae bacterium]